jgi:hypothetical protein
MENETIFLVTFDGSCTSNNTTGRTEEHFRWHGTHLIYVFERNTLNQATIHETHISTVNIKQNIRGVSQHTCNFSYAILKLLITFHMQNITAIKKWLNYKIFRHTAPIGHTMLDYSVTN